MGDYYEFTFGTSTGKRKQIRVINPNMTLDSAAILSAGQLMKNYNIFDSNTGTLSILQKATRVKETVNTIV